MPLSPSTSAMPAASRATRIFGFTLTAPPRILRTYCGRRKMPWLSAPWRSARTINSAQAAASVAGRPTLSRASATKPRKEAADRRGGSELCFSSFMPFLKKTRRISPPHVYNCAMNGALSACVRSRRDKSRTRAVSAFVLLRDSDQRHGIHQAVGQHEVALFRDRGVAHDVAAARDRPALELRGLGIEAHDGIRLGLGLAVPDDIVDRRDAVGRGLRSARGLPLRDFAGRGIQTAQV